MKPPAFQFYADDFLAGTFSMSNEERGLYITLLCRQWTQGHVTPDEVLRLGSTTVQPSVNHVLTKFVADSDGNLKNHRLEAERDKQTAFRALQSQKGKASAKARFNHGSTTVQPSGAPKVNSPSPSPSPSTSLTESATPPSVEKVLKAKKPKPEAPDPRREEFVSIFREFIESAGVQYDRPNAADNAQLKTMLKRKPDMTAEDWRDYLIYINDNSRGQYAPTLLKDCGSIALVCSKMDRIQTYKDREGK